MNIGTPIRFARRRVLVAALMACVPLSASAAGLLDGEFEVRNATAIFNQGVVELSAEVRYPLTDPIRQALRDGVTLAFDLEIGVSRPRRFWFDSDVVSLNLRRELSYHVISDRDRKSVV